MSSQDDQASVNDGNLFCFLDRTLNNTSPAMSFYRILFWQKCQEMQLGMKMLINIFPGLKL